MRVTKAVITVLVLATGCMGGVEDVPPGGNGPDAGPSPTAKKGKQMFVADVHSIVQKCSGGGCHSQGGVTGMYGFALADANASYDQVVNLPTLVGAFTTTTAQILTKIDTNPAGGHKGVTYSADDKSKITAWLAQEATDRSDGTQPPPIDPIAKIREWSGCMSLDNFNTAQMAQKWALLTTSTTQACKNCHGQGQAAFMSGVGQAEPFFTTITTQRDLLLKYFTVDGTGKVVINTASFKNAGETLTTHPKFAYADNIGMTALQTFYDATLARQTAGTCDPPRLPQ